MGSFVSSILMHQFLVTKAALFSEKLGSIELGMVAWMQKTVWMEVFIISIFSVGGTPYYFIDPKVGSEIFGYCTALMACVDFVFSCFATYLYAKPLVSLLNSAKRLREERQQSFADSFNNPIQKSLVATFAGCFIAVLATSFTFFFSATQVLLADGQGYNAKFSFITAVCVESICKDLGMVLLSGCYRRIRLPNIASLIPSMFAKELRSNQVSVVPNFVVSRTNSSQGRDLSSVVGEGHFTNFTRTQGLEGPSLSSVAGDRN